MDMRIQVDTLYSFAALLCCMFHLHILSLALMRYLDNEILEDTMYRTTNKNKFDQHIVTVWEVMLRVRSGLGYMLQVDPRGDNLVLSNGLIMWIGHWKEIWKLTFRALAFVGALHQIHSHERLMIKTSTFESLYSGQLTLSSDWLWLYTKLAQVFWNILCCECVG